MYERLSKVKDWEGLASQAAFDPATIATRCRVSLRHLERFFAQHFHQTPRQWCTALRFKIASQLIAQGYSNKAIAAELGFADPSHFCHQFKNCCGLSPQSVAPLWDRSEPPSPPNSERACPQAQQANVCNPSRRDGRE